MPTIPNSHVMMILPIDVIRPHEEYDHNLLVEITNSLQSEKVIRDPLLISSKSFVIMDGTHRYWALKRLGCRCVPAALYDYSSYEVSIGCWYRCIGSQIQLQKDQKATVSSRGKALEAVRNRVSLMSLISNDMSLTWDTDHFDIHMAYHLLSDLESKMKENGCSISYASEKDALEKLDLGMVNTVLASPPISKEEVISAATLGKLFPKKSTRHMINSRPMGLRVPLEWLNEPAKDADVHLQDLLSRGHFSVLQKGSIINGRRYEEEVYSFELKLNGEGPKNW